MGSLSGLKMTVQYQSIPVDQNLMVDYYEIFG